MKTPIHPHAVRGLLLAIMIAVLSAGPVSEAIHRNAYPLPEERGTAGILASLERLPVFVRVLYTMAHPDDESGASLTWLARRVHARTALFSLTRGDGGQNVLGDEKYEAMGLLRTGELLEACRIYGVEPYFSTVFEFGFSKSSEETLAKWGHEATLEELVRFIRWFRPAVIISRWGGDSGDGHGHHQAAGKLTLEAFRAAGDPARFPQHADAGLRHWQARKLYQSVRDQAGGSQGRPGGAEAEWTVRVNVGEHDPVLGRSFLEIGSEGYSKHRSQGNGARHAPPGASFEYHRLLDAIHGTPPAEERSLFDSLDTSLMSIAEAAKPELGAMPFLVPDLAAAQSAAERALRAFSPREPERSAPEAARGYAVLAELVRKVEAAAISRETRERLQDAIEEKKADFQNAVHASLGIYLVAGTEDPTAAPGERISATVFFYNRGREQVDVKKVSLWTPEGWVAGLPADAPLGPVEPGGRASFMHAVEISRDAGVTEPFWYREGPQEARYRTRPTRNPFAPFAPPEITAQVTYRYRDTDIPILAPLRAAVADPIRGIDYRDFQVVPAISLHLDPDFAVVPLSDRTVRREFRASLLCNERNGVRGELRIEAPAGWKIDPPGMRYELSRKGESFSGVFAVHLPESTREGTFRLEAVAAQNGREYRRGYRVVSYPENWTRQLYSPSSAEVKVFDVRILPGLTVGYVPGAGDEIPGALEQLGVRVEMLSDTQLAFGDLARFSAIVTGIRAYNVNEALRANNRRLLKYVEDGGSLIVQYNTPASRSRNVPFAYSPYPMSGSAGDRITVEDSRVRILDPQHPVLTLPNRITAADFEGWVQERGLYFMSDWDPRYAALLSGNDPGETPKNGGLLVARFGKGYYIFTGYAWFRQLPAGVPGAFRIFANMLSLGKTR